MKKLFSLVAIGMMVTWLGVACKKETDKPTPPTVPEPSTPGQPNEPVNTPETSPHILKAVTKNIPNSNAMGYYVALPSRYDQTDIKYPILIYLHGAGQIGNGSTELHRVLNAGTAKVIADKKFPPNFQVDGQNYSFIVVMPQFRGEPSVNDVKGFVDYALANYRHDPKRVYVSGSSMGGRKTAAFACTFPTIPAAIVPMAGALFYDLEKNAKNIADNRVAAWLFHNENDVSISVDESKNFVKAVNSFNPAIKARITVFPWSDSPQGHDAWTIPTNPDYKENGVNIYEWMLQYKR
jgi:predicted peptidase